MSRALFISCEGGEGVGKTSFIQALTPRLQALASDLLLTREPGGTAIAEKIRDVFNNPPQQEIFTPLAELFLISAARSQHVAHKIAPALQQGRWVLCDRFFDSTFVYQGMLRGLPAEFLHSVVMASCQQLQPDLTFVLDCPVEVSWQRIQQRQSQQGAHRYDAAKREVHERLRRGFLDLAQQQPERIKILDSSQNSPDQLAELAMTWVRKKLA